ncbi:hypothetical protein HNQ92_002214 [Rhabdobacter roseus]|uniref:Heparinase II/III-like C-terminal domain-containing protein n=1 Tax=Rhabdobacter roseus TaxID=1655419 RepID=A0A840TKP3_9BACT|nr:hypothetical protein [Rhabdobacter roseus]
MLLLIRLAGPPVGAQSVPERNIVYGEYQQKSTSGDIFDVGTWREQKRTSLIKNIAQLPDSVKQILLGRADEALQREWPVLTLSKYLLYTQTGDRNQYESRYFGRRNKLTLLVIGELVERKGRYLPEIADGLWLMLEETSWAVPATLNLLQQGGGLAHNEPVIDLFVSETAALLAWTRLLLPEELSGVSPLLLSRLDDELQSRVITPYIERDDFWWMGFVKRQRPNNWNVFCNKNTLITTLIVENDAERQRKVLDKSMRTIDLFINHYPEDGGCDEGPGYWSMAGGGLGDYLTILTEVSNRRLDFSKNELLHHIGTYIHKMQIDGRRFVNFADATPFIAPDPAKIYHYGQLFNDEQLLQFAAYCYPLSNLWRAGFASRETMNSFVDNVEAEAALRQIRPHAPLLPQNWLPDLQVLSLRQRAGDAKSLFVGAKGGHNGESHNHNDVGNFVLYLDGQPFLIDLGPSTYRKETFNNDRWKIWNFQSAWHNCPTINGVPQKNGRNFAARGTSFSTKKNQQVLSLDLAGAYPPEAEVARWQRELVFKPTEGTLALNEAYELKAWKEPFQIHFMTAQPAQAVKAGVLRLVAEGTQRTILFKYDPAAFELVQEEKAVEDGLLARSWGEKVYRTTMRAKGKALKGKHSFVFSIAE